MNKFVVSILSICSLLLITACNTDTDNSMQDREQIAEQLDPNRNYDHKSNQDVNHELGYVRYSKDEIDMQRLDNQEAKIDRPEMADMITKLILSNDGFNEVATLVTDQEVLIAFEKEDNSDSERTKDIARKTAESVMPSFYETHVTDNKSFMYDIQSLHNSNTNRDYDNLINDMIDEMEGPSEES